MLNRRVFDSVVLDVRAPQPLCGQHRRWEDATGKTRRGPGTAQGARGAPFPPRGPTQAQRCEAGAAGRDVSFEQDANPPGKGLPLPT